MLNWMQVAEDGTGDVIELWIPRATAELPLARLKEKEKKKNTSTNTL